MCRRNEKRILAQNGANNFVEKCSMFMLHYHTMFRNRDFCKICMGGV